MPCSRAFAWAAKNVAVFIVFISSKGQVRLPGDAVGCARAKRRIGRLPKAGTRDRSCRACRMAGSLGAVRQGNAPHMPRATIPVTGASLCPLYPLPALCARDARLPDGWQPRERCIRATPRACHAQPSALRVHHRAHCIPRQHYAHVIHACRMAGSLGSGASGQHPAHATRNHPRYGCITVPIVSPASTLSTLSAGSSANTRTIGKALSRSWIIAPASIARKSRAAHS